jgi:hypothetical protein
MTLDDSEDNLEEAELAPCCANISYIRELLHKAMTGSGLDGMQRKHLIDVLVAHECTGEATPNLSNILGQLGLVWSDFKVIVDGVEYKQNGEQNERNERDSEDVGTSQCES